MGLEFQFFFDRCFPFKSKNSDQIHISPLTLQTKLRNRSEQKACMNTAISTQAFWQQPEPTRVSQRVVCSVVTYPLRWCFSVSRTRRCRARADAHCLLAHPPQGANVIW
jgi:hypothetical protein